MEGDSIRAKGTSTLVDLWLGDRVRSICVTRGAIGASIGFAAAETMTDQERCGFVRSNLSLVLAAAKAAVNGGQATDPITIEGSALVVGSSPGEDRREGERRKSKRRRSSHSKSSPAGVERRRSERRADDRRRASGPSTSV